MDIAIIVVCYKRSNCFERLMSQITSCNCPQAIDLIISIDFSNYQKKMQDIARKYEWPYGRKKIILKKNNIGLKQHIIECGDMVFDYDAIIVLEEDLIVSPYFIKYSIAAARYYQGVSEIAGISLYSYNKRESDNLDFIPIEDGKDVYFMQTASSWGQVWLKEQWVEFRSWLEMFDCESFNDIKVPQHVNRWPKNSWKKHFIRYMVNNDKYFVFPRVSLTTNPGADGENHNYIKNLYSSPLLLGDKQWCFKVFDRHSDFFYDSRFLLKFKSACVDAKYSDIVEFKYGQFLGGAKYHFSLNPYRTTFYIKVFAFSLKNDFKKLFHKIKRRLV